MKKTNKFLLILGISLILGSFLCIGAMVYFVGQASLKKEEKIASLEVELVNVISEKSQKILPDEDARLVKREPVNLDDFLERAEVLYGPEEMSRRQGVLWVDRTSSMYLVTLGRIHGLEKGKRLSIYKREKKIGEIEIESSFDIISYARPIDMTIIDFSEDYYRVVIEDLS